MYLFSFCPAEFPTVFEDVLTIYVLRLSRPQNSMKRRRAFPPMSAWERFTGLESRYLCAVFQNLRYPFFWDVTSPYWVFDTWRVETWWSSLQGSNYPRTCFYFLVLCHCLCQSGRVPFVVRGLLHSSLSLFSKLPVSFVSWTLTQSYLAFPFMSLNTLVRLVSDIFVGGLRRRKWSLKKYSAKCNLVRNGAECPVEQFCPYIFIKRVF
jgi:hypothetical protein